ncbi:MAG: TIGR00303 family protein [Nanopusillaceae archaeon]
MPWPKLAEAVLAVHAYPQCQAFWTQIQDLHPHLVLTVANTLTAYHPGLTAVPVMAAPADAEILFTGAPRSQPTIPTHPLGIPGPVLISRAMLVQLPHLSWDCIDAGCLVTPQLPGVKVWGDRPGGCVASGWALPRARVETLWQQAYSYGHHLGKHCQTSGRYLILAESVPAGTTTALGVLLALGLDAEQRISSSLANPTHRIKLELLANLRKGSYRLDPLGAVAAVGDPMQPVVAGLALAASRFCPVLLAGGTQMLAVLALLTAFGQPGSLAIGTTGWVVRDPYGDFVGLAALIQEQRGGHPIPCLAADWSFQHSSLRSLRGYEQGHVKEGAGAGGLSLAALRHRHPQQLLSAIEGQGRQWGFA